MRYNIDTNFMSKEDKWPNGKTDNLTWFHSEYMSLENNDNSVSGLTQEERFVIEEYAAIKNISRIKMNVLEETVALSINCKTDEEFETKLDHYLNKKYNGIETDIRSAKNIYIGYLGWLNDLK